MPGRALASNGLAGHIQGLGPPPVYVHIDVIMKVSRGSEYRRTETALEQGAALTVHRQRVPETVKIDIVISDAEPVPGVFFTPLWEIDHANKTLARLIETQASATELKIWDGRKNLRTPAGTAVWVLDSFDHIIEGTETRVLRASLRFGEAPRFSTLFTPALPDTDSAISDAVGGTAERGRQSTSASSPATSAAVVMGAFP